MAANEGRQFNGFDMRLTDDPILPGGADPTTVDVTGRWPRGPRCSTRAVRQAVCAGRAARGKRVTPPGTRIRRPPCFHALGEDPGGHAACCYGNRASVTMSDIAYLFEDNEGRLFNSDEARELVRRCGSAWIFRVRRAAHLPADAPAAPVVEPAGDDRRH